MYSCLFCPATFNHAKAGPVGITCPSCTKVNHVTELETNYGPPKGIHKLCHACKSPMRELALGIQHCTNSQCNALYCFPGGTENSKICASSNCWETIYLQNNTCFLANKTYWCDSHSPPTGFNTICPHDDFRASGNMFGILEEWQCIGCSNWYGAKFSDHRPAINPAMLSYVLISTPSTMASSSPSSTGTLVSGGVSPPITGHIFGVSAGTPTYPFLPGWTPFGGSWIGHGMDWGDAACKERSKKCVECGVELCEYLDRYWGKDTYEASLCSPCRLGRRPKKEEETA